MQLCMTCKIISLIRRMQLNYIRSSFEVVILKFGEVIMNKRVLISCLTIFLFLFVSCDEDKSPISTLQKSQDPLNAVVGDWRTGHAIYTINETELKFSHLDEKSGVEDYGFNGVVVSKTTEGDYVRIVAFVTELTTVAPWVDADIEGYVTLFGGNLIDGVNADFVRSGTPGYSKDPVIKTRTEALARVVPEMVEGSKWLTYDPESNPTTSSYLFDDIQGSWRSGHAEYHINGDELIFRHFDNKSGVEDFGFVMTIKTVTSMDKDLSIVASIDSITTSANWMKGPLEGYVNLFAKNILTGTNVDFVRAGTPGFDKDPLLTSEELAKAVAMPSADGKWLTYDVK